MGDFAEGNGIGRKEGPGTVYNPPKPGQVAYWDAVQQGLVHASFLICYGMLGAVLFFEPKNQR